MRRTKSHNNRGTSNISVPVQLHIGSFKFNWQIVRDGPAILFAGSCFTNVTLENLRLGDPWELVRRYLSVDAKDENSVLQFLNAHGEFGPPEGSTVSGRVTVSQLPVRCVWKGDWDEAKGMPKEAVMESVSLAEFAMIQDHARRMLITGNPALPTPWQKGYVRPYQIVFADDTSGFKAHVSVSYTYPSILATIQFKLVQGAKFRVCARKDCRLPFEVTSRHSRRFCTQYCAHLTALRRRRKMEQSAKKEMPGGTK